MHDVDQAEVLLVDGHAELFASLAYGARGGRLVLQMTRWKVPGVRGVRGRGRSEAEEHLARPLEHQVNADDVGIWAHGGSSLTATKTGDWTTSLISAG